jgi:sugar phosphate isomerase/epimerase
MTWRIGASTGGCLERPVLEVVDAIRQAGIDAVEVGTPPRHFDPWRHTEVQALRQCLSGNGIRAVSIHAPFGGLLDLSDPNPHHRHAAIGAILTAAGALKELGGRHVVVHPSDVERQGTEVPLRLRLIRESLLVLARACDQLNLVLTVESPLPHLIGGNAREFAWLLEGLPPGVAVCLDTAHTSLGHQWPQFLDVSRGRLAHIHASDHHGRFDDHLPPGEGVLDWAAIGRDLQRDGFEGWIMLELRCPEGSLADYFGRAISRMRLLLPAADQPDAPMRLPESR